MLWRKPPPGSGDNVLAENAAVMRFAERTHAEERAMWRALDGETQPTEKPLKYVRGLPHASNNMSPDMWSTLRNCSTRPWTTTSSEMSSQPDMHSQGPKTARSSWRPGLLAELQAASQLDGSSMLSCSDDSDSTFSLNHIARYCSGRPASNGSSVISRRTPATPLSARSATERPWSQGTSIAASRPASRAASVRSKRGEGSTLSARSASSRVSQGHAKQRGSGNASGVGSNIEWLMTAQPMVERREAFTLEPTGHRTIFPTPLQSAPKPRSDD
eukprot:TRINITY_DN34917_c0_g1_i1.p1 TRINITY_DN34917_c0_g1~~TRINITY_DN34917_c0_g1_i1.p1  ORF type:complete len:283 (-),score=41.88 TRINITY_DN34917_c0_g1_i1:43-861(-)